jgi:MFS family permease
MIDLAQAQAETAPGRLSVVGISATRILLYANFMTAAACIPTLRQAWGLSAAEAGSIVTSFTIGYALSLFAFGWLAERQGAKRATVLSVLASALASAAFGLFARDYVSALVLYGLVGLTQGGSYTPLIMVFSDNTPAERRGAAMGWLIASTSLGYALSLMLSAAALAISGWPLAFLVTGLLPALGALALLWLLREARNVVHERPAGGGAVSLAPGRGRFAGIGR